MTSHPAGGPLRAGAAAAAAASALLAATAPAPAFGRGPQASPGRGPQPPGGRLVSSAADCAALQKEWDQYKAEWGRQHQACLDSYERSNVQPGPTCSKAPCQQLHYLVYEYASSESSRMMSECRAAVDRIERQKAEIERQKAENEAAVRRYNQQVAEQNRRLLEALNQQNAAVAEQNRLAQEAVARRNEAAQREFERLARDLHLRAELAADRTAATLSAMRETLRTGVSQFGQRVSDLVDELGSTTFGGLVNQTADAADLSGKVFDGLNVAAGLETPERVTTAIERLQDFAAGWNIFQAGRASLSAGASADERFHSQITALSSSTTFLFRSTPWVGSLVSSNIESIGRTYDTAWQILDDSLKGVDHSTDDINDAIGRSLFPGAAWANDKLKQIQGSASQLAQLLGR